jgi:hypothetical protein
MVWQRNPAHQQDHAMLPINGTGNSSGDDNDRLAVVAGELVTGMASPEYSISAECQTIPCLNHNRTELTEGRNQELT